VGTDTAEEHMASTFRVENKEEAMINITVFAFCAIK
jgi:hypothetical protein